MIRATMKAHSRLLQMLAFAFLLGCYPVAETAAGESGAGNCDASSTLTPLATEIASAGFLSNLSSRADSIRATSKRMLDEAIGTVRSDASAQRIVLKSIPELSKKIDSDDQMCERLETETQKAPLEFNGKHFASADELTDWIMNFTQGKGADGKSLYKQCPGKCSPQYTWWIDPGESGLMVNARVVCGLPRDRDGDKYHLSIALAASCASVESK
jgi:hypothetical protein